MQKSTSVILGEHFAHFINAHISTGRYGSASEVIRAGLRLLEDQEASRDSLQAALIAGERSGLSDRTADDIFEAVRQRHEQSETAHD